MAYSVNILNSTEAEQETWFLESLSAERIAFDDLAEFLMSLASTGRVENAATWSEMLQDAIGERCMFRETVRLLIMRQQWSPDAAVLAAAGRKALENAFRNRNGLAYLKNCGLDKQYPFEEILRRLTQLLLLKPGVMCYEKTWGFGVVAKSDDFYEKIVVDFDKKAGHQFSFSYAAETLEIIRDDHLLAMRKTNPGELKRLLADDQAEVVRIAIRSFGQISVNRLREQLIEGGIIRDAEWKPFWEAARKKLKSDPTIDIPASREAPIAMLAGGATRFTESLRTLRGERDTENIVTLIHKIEESSAFGSMPQDDRNVCEERLAFAVRAVRGKDHAATVVMLLTAKRLGLNSQVDIPGITKEMLNGDSFILAAGGLSQRDTAKWIRHLGETDSGVTCDMLLSVTDRLPAGACADVVAYLVECGRQKEIAARISELVRSEAASVDIVLWLCRNLDTVMEWGISPLMPVLMLAVKRLCEDYSFKRLQVQKHLRTLVEQHSWLATCCAILTQAERELLLVTVNNAKEWEDDSRRTVMAEMVKMYPELKTVLTQVASKEVKKEAGIHRFTSWRSYKQRTEQLRKLLDEDLPKNSKEIAVARSYGDLRENAEYKAAKEHQALLCRRRDQWAVDLEAVRATDFAEFPSEVAGIGTRVVVKGQDGSTQAFCLLGEWDGDENLGIISSKSDIATRLIDKKSGDVVQLQGPAGDISGTVIEVTGLPDNVKEWIRS